MSQPFAYFNLYKDNRVGFAIDKKDLPTNLILENDTEVSMNIKGLPAQVKDLLNFKQL